MTYIVPHSSARLECVEFRENNQLDHYGRLVLGPLASGQGVTLGNTFRRIMLNDLSGVAITAAKINNARTEFTTLPGIRESVVEIFLNLREVVFFNDFPEVLAPRGKITIPPCVASDETAQHKKDGESPTRTLDTLTDIRVPTTRLITAGDMELPQGIRCVDPTQPIATLVDEQAALDLAFVLEQGTGYRVWKKPTQPQSGNLYPARPDLAQKFKELASGLFQPIDGNFMPIRTVNFSVHDMPPSGEYVHFEITTNGSLHPKEAFQQAGAILTEITRAAMQEPTYEPIPDVQVVPAPKSAKETEYHHSISIEELEISLRAYNCLKRAQILTLADLSKQSYQSLLSLRNFGQKSAEEVRKALSTYGIELRQEA